MPKVTVAVPVYNEADFLAATLENLRAQTFTDFEVLIFDNASTDETARVAADFAARDSRFRHVRQPENKGALRNFHESLLAANSGYFMWRAADDRCDANYIESLAALLDANPTAAVAVCDIVTSDLDGANARRLAWPDDAGRVGRILGARASWIYGLWRREDLTRRMNEVMAAYPDAFGFDHLVLLEFLFDDRVTGTHATTFFQIKKRIKSPGAAKRERSAAEIDKMIDLRGRFLRVARETVARRVSSPGMRRVWDALLWIYTGKRLFAFHKTLRRRLGL